MVRVVPYSHHMRTVCLRVEILGCEATKESNSNFFAALGTEPIQYLPILLGSFLLVCVLMVTAVISVLIQQLRSKAAQELPTESHYQSSWFLQKSQSEYCEPSTISQEEHSAVRDFYSTPLMTSSAHDHHCYAVPQTTSSYSTLSSMRTFLSSMEESAVDSSSLSSTPRLPPVPSFDTLDISTSRHLKLYVEQNELEHSRSEPEYANIMK